MAVRVAQTAVFLALVGASLSALAVGPAVVKPEYPDMCWVADQNRTFPIGGQWQEPNCVRATCHLYSSRLYVEYATCGIIGLTPEQHLNCKTVQDLKLPYPECCPTVSCSNTPALAFVGQEELNNMIGEYRDQSTPNA